MMKLEEGILLKEDAGFVRYQTVGVKCITVGAHVLSCNCRRMFEPE